MKFSCAHCKSDLTRSKSDGRISFYCHSCGGQAYKLSLLQKSIDKKMMQSIWQKTLEEDSRPGRHCPFCRKEMQEIDLQVDILKITIDACRPCQSIWFDHGELQSLPTLPDADKSADIYDSLEKADQSGKLNQDEKHKILALKKELALKEVQEIAREKMSAPVTPTFTQYCIALIGYPIEARTKSIANHAIVTWLAIALCIITFYLQLNYHQTLSWAFVPEYPYRHFGLTFFTTFFLHADILHLTGNLYFLFILGDNVEDFLGKSRFILLLALATACGAALHGIIDPRSTMPLVGASGGIAGIMGFYGLLIPRARFGLVVLFKWFTVPASGLLVVWSLMQFIGAYFQVKGMSSVSALAHLGGLIIGILFWLVFTKMPHLKAR